MEAIENYALGMGANEEVMAWVRTTLKKRYEKARPPSQEAVEHLLDYLCSSDGPRKLVRMSVLQAMAKAEAWSKTQQKKGKQIEEEESDVVTIHDFGDGTRIVKLDHPRAYKREGFLMRHCVGSYADRNVTIYSYRDRKNLPHATFEVSSSGQDINQIKGKGNGPISPKYIRPILAFLESIGKRPRESEMKNLGYYYLKDDLKAYIEGNFEAEVKVEVLYGKQYIAV